MKKEESEGLIEKPEVVNDGQTDLLARISELESTNKRLLEESKRNKERARALEEEKNQVENEVLGKEKDPSKILQNEQKKIEKLLKENREIKSKALTANIRSTIAKFASDAVDLDDVVNQPNFSSILKDGIDGDSLTLDEDAAKRYVEEVYKAKPYLRKQTSITQILTQKPGYSKNTNKDIRSMDSKEIEETLRSLYK